VSLAELEAEILKLAPEEQACLLHRLAVALDSHDEPKLTNEELQKRWSEFEQTGEAVEASKLHERARKRYGI
jgi:hypothetical protein